MAVASRPTSAQLCTLQLLALDASTLVVFSLHISFVPSVFVAAVLTHTDNCSTAVNRCATVVSGPDAQCASASSLHVFAVFVD